jgi:ubiquinone/menaquinone biosynthesis C-methylase UbiE
MKNLFINPATGEELNVEHHVVDIDQWMSGNFNRQVVCGKDQKGVWIFTHPKDIDKTDEYRSGDPYNYKTESDSFGFHQGRMDCTKNLVGKYLSMGTPPFNLLDIGCGLGHLTAQIKNGFPHLQTCYALDMSYTACREGKQLYPELEFIVGDAYSPPFRNKCFDIVLMNNIWEHVPDPCRMLEAVSRILKDDGVVIISTPNRFRFTNVVRLAATGKCKLVSTHHVTEYSLGQVVEQLKFSGFTIVEAAASPSGGSRYPVKFLSRILRMILCCTRSRLAFESTLFFMARKK